MKSAHLRFLGAVLGGAWAVMCLFWAGMVWAFKGERDDDMNSGEGGRP